MPLCYLEENLRKNCKFWAWSADWEIEAHVDKDCWCCWAVAVLTLMVRWWITAWSFRTILSRTFSDKRFAEGMGVGESLIGLFIAHRFPSSTSAMVLGWSQPGLSSLWYGCKLLSSLCPITAHTSFGEKPASFKSVTTEARTQWLV